MIRALFLVFTLCLSFSALAGYECELKLAHTEELQTEIAQMKVSIADSRMVSGSHGELLREHTKGNRSTALMVNGFMNGWSSEEEAVLVILRKHAKKSSSSSELISERFSLRGDDQGTFWFDSYKLDINCKVTK